jgi:site-specific recombinase XerD
MAKSNLRLVPPTEVKRTVAPKRQKNAEVRTREHLTPSEVETLIEAVGANRYGHRDATMVLLTYRHGLRAAEVCDLRWDQVDFNGAVLHVRAASPFVFVSERGSPFTTAGFARMIERAAAGAGLELKVHPHMLRHACGYALANKGPTLAA